MDLDLFTPIKDFKPILRKNTIVLEEGIAQFYIVLAFWNGENWIDTETKTMCLPSHVLDLSKLTTKERAKELCRVILDAETGLNNDDIGFIELKANEIL